MKLTKSARAEMIDYLGVLMRNLAKEHDSRLEMRIIGAIEMTLVVLGYMSLHQPIKRLPATKRPLFWGLSITVQETYKAAVLRGARLALENEKEANWPFLPKA